MALLGMRLVYTSPASRPRPAFEFMEQQLVWRTLADTAVAFRALMHAGARPLPPPPGARAAARRAPGAWESFRSWVGFGAQPSAADADGGSLAPGACVMCGADPPHTPQLAACGHRLCYFCFASARLHGGRARCPHPQCSATLELASAAS